jgi:hypothetical protein
MSFKTKNYQVIKQVISKDLTDFIYKYFLLKRQVADTLFKNNDTIHLEHVFGTWNDPMVPSTYSHYADIVMETLLCKIHPIMEQITDLKLTPNYSYARIYKKGDILKKHKDRFSCEISNTLNLGGDLWPIFLKYKNKKIKINLHPGDMLVYKGALLEHWRERFKRDHCAQVFLHYNNIKTEGSDKNLFDTRPHLGLPEIFQKKILL